ncbi:MAG: hypothetical protein IJB61_02870 [Bacteroides sp]|nr:hypothetical protein [Bacteroides sp.]
MKKNLIKMMLAAIVVLASGVNIYNSQNKGKMSDVVLANVDALADHGEIDGTLVPYRKLSSMTILILFDGKVMSTEIPCCKDDTSPYSGCAKGLDTCV